MNIHVLQQPFDEAGRLSRLGAELINQLTSGNFNEVHIFSAYVTRSGTQRLGPALQGITRSGGICRAVIGINNGLTSVQAVNDLHRAGVEVLGLNTGNSILYHPKVYVLRGASRAWISIGSSNLTGEGLYRNVETNTLIELDLAMAADVAIVNQVLAALNRFRDTYRQNAIGLLHDTLELHVNSGELADEVGRARERRTRPNGARRRQHRGPDAVPPIIVPALPASVWQEPIRREQPPEVREPAAISVPAPTVQTSRFAMVLSAHDASKKTTMPGTPELSLPRQARDFFPPVVLAGRQFPDAYFAVRLNAPEGARTVEYRIWERPAGAGAGHADLRINIKHDTVDLTRDGGGDIILFEATLEERGPAYDVWIIHPDDPQYDQLLERCTHVVAARGAGEAKRYGFF